MTAMSADRNILVTNDDGIDSVGLHVLARAMARFGTVTVVAPDREYSGAGASIGALHEADPVVREVEVDGVDKGWTVTGPPALCVFYARMGAFGFAPDLVVSGINPGANLGRAVYHSGTIGAALTARNGGIPGIAVSQKFADIPERDPQATFSGPMNKDVYDEIVSHQLWDSAAEIAAEVVDAMFAAGAGFADGDPAATGVLNLNVPNLPVDEIKGWRWTQVGLRPPSSMTQARLIPREPSSDGTAYRVEATWGTGIEQPADTDGAAIRDDLVSLTWLSRITALDQPTTDIDRRLAAVLPG